MAFDIDSKRPVVLTEHTALLRRSVPPIGEFLESINDECKQNLLECLNRFPFNIPMPYPFQTAGSGKRIEQHLKDSGYNWVSIEDLFPQPDTDGGRLVNTGWTKTSVKRRLNTLSPQMKIDGIRTTMATTPVKFFEIESAYRGDGVGLTTTVKYDTEKTIQSKKPKRGRWKDTTIGNTDDAPLFFVFGPTNPFVLDEDSRLYETDEQNRLIFREFKSWEFDLVVVPSSKKNPFVINQSLRSKGNPESHIGLNLTDDWAQKDGIWGTLHTSRVQSYSMRSDWNVRVESLDAEFPDISALPLSREEIQEPMWKRAIDYIEETLMHNYNYNYMTDSYISINKDQLNLLTHRGKIWKAGGIGESGMIQWGCDGHGHGIVLYGVMMKSEGNAERDFLLKTMDFGIINSLELSTVR